MIMFLLILYSDADFCQNNLVLVRGKQYGKPQENNLIF